MELLLLLNLSVFSLGVGELGAVISVDLVPPVLNVLAHVTVTLFAFLVLAVTVGFFVVGVAPARVVGCCKGWESQQ